MKTFLLSLILVLAPFATASAQQPTLSPNFSGDDPTTLLRQLADLRKRLVKSEFETTAAYKARIIEENKKAVLDSRTSEDTFYLVANKVEAEYNADTETMTFALRVRTNYPAELSRTYNLEEKVAATDLSQVTMYDVSLGDYTDPRVFFDSSAGLSGSRYSRKFMATAKLNVDEARRLKTGTKAVLVVRFEEPYAIQKDVAGGQFQVRLINVQFFDQQTGRVLASIGSPESTSQIKPDVTPPPQEPDYSSYRKNPTFKMPRIIFKPEPRYTEEARRNSVTGTVVLHALFAETGQITRISVVKGLPYGLTERAIAATRLIQFEPAELDGKKVAYLMEFVYNFDLY